MSAGSRGRDAIGIGLASFVSCAIIAWINADNSVIGSIYPHQYLDLAKFFLGESDREVVTYPMWGYPLVLAATHYREFLSLGLQCLLASGSLALLYFCAAPALCSTSLNVKCGAPEKSRIGVGVDCRTPKESPRVVPPAARGI